MKRIIYLLSLLVMSIFASCNKSDWWNRTKSLTKADIGKIEKIKVNGQVHKVRLIGVDEDKDNEDKTIHTTWEFVNLLSDNKGYSLATYWNNTKVEDTASDDYMNSSIRKALTNEGNGKIYWFEKDGNKYSTIYKKSVLDMFPKSLIKVLTAPSKCVNIYNGDDWEEKIVNDKLFLLSPVELGRTEHVGEEKTTEPYSYYDGADNAKRIKKQIKGSKGARNEPVENIEGLNTDHPSYSFAGYNSLKSNEGGEMWLRSPYKHLGHPELDRAWCISHFGSFPNNTVYSSALAIAPAFCI